MIQHLHFVVSFLLILTSNEDVVVNPPDQVPDPVVQKYTLPNIDLSHWKVTIPVGKPAEVEPPEILQYATNETLLPFMYNDSTDGSLVFYAFPNQSTQNTKYSRSELREQMAPGNDNVNWKFADGAIMTGILAVPSISRDAGGKSHRTIIMQIHGRLTADQQALIKAGGTDAPPVLKIYWQNNKVRILTKKLKNPATEYPALLHKSSWEDNEAFYFDEEVGHEKFRLEVKVSEGRLAITLNNAQTVVYDDENMAKWGVFDNYFKAGNYLQTTDSGASAIVKYYELNVEH